VPSHALSLTSLPSPLAFAASMTSPAALPYHEPGIITILVHSSFLILLNATNYILDRVLYCGLIGQIFIGIAFGTPGAQWLGQEVERVVVQLGYLGLILLVYEGGLSTSFPFLRANLLLSLAVALTGIAIPIAFSFILQGLVSASPLQAFAAGAALCSTSLGTTFTILGTSGLTNTRLGTVLTSAAMMDDIVGLVMVQVISNLGDNSEFNAITVVRPLFVSLGFGVACPVICRLCIVRLTSWLKALREKSPTGWIQTLFTLRETAFAVHTLLLVAMVTASTYAGTSNLFAAYLAGAMVSWWDSEVPHLVPRTSESDKSPGSVAIEGSNRIKQPQSGNEASGAVPTELLSGKAIYHSYYSKPVNTILKPLFFVRAAPASSVTSSNISQASIGFSIPITRMFTGSVVWRGIIFTMLMSLGKLACGAWLIRFHVSLPRKLHPNKLTRFISCSTIHFGGKGNRIGSPTVKPSHSIEFEDGREDRKRTTTDEPTPISLASMENISTASNAPLDTNTKDPTPTSKILSPKPAKPLSLHPASILGLAMVARGEIGFLISSLAESKGIFGEESGEIFLVVTWAIVLCTIIGPVGVGLLVRRLKRLERQRDDGGGGRDVLGVWGVSE
jgi:Kef-type K+ transport system membrane component KefB